MNDHSWIGGCIYYAEKKECEHRWGDLNQAITIDGDRYRVFKCFNCGIIKYEIIK